MDSEKYLREKHPDLTEEQARRVLAEAEKSSEVSVLRGFFSDTEVGNITLVLTMISAVFLSSRCPVAVQTVSVCINMLSAFFWAVHASFRYVPEYDNKKLPQKEKDRLQVVIFYSILTFFSVMFVDYMSGTRLIDNPYLLASISADGSMLMLSIVFLLKDKYTCRRLDALDLLVTKELSNK